MISQAAQTEIQPAKFDYGKLKASIRREVERHTGEILRIRQRVTSERIKMGEHLLAVRALLPRPQFRAWCESETGWSDAYARSVMRACQRFGKMDGVAQMSFAGLLLLARESTPKFVIEEAFRLARSGLYMTQERIQTVLIEHLPADERPRANIKTFRRICDNVERNLQRCDDRQRPVMVAAVARIAASYGAAAPIGAHGTPPSIPAKIDGRTWRPSKRVKDEARRLVKELSLDDLECLYFVLDGFIREARLGDHANGR